MRWFFSKKELKSMGTITEWVCTALETLAFCIITAFTLFAMAIVFSAFTVNL